MEKSLRGLEPLSSRMATESTRMKRAPLTRDEVIEGFIRRGETITGWAQRNGLKPHTVRGLLFGRSRGRFGAAHRAAVLLGLKDGELTE